MRCDDDADGDGDADGDAAAGADADAVSLSFFCPPHTYIFALIIDDTQRYLRGLNSGRRGKWMKHFILGKSNLSTLLVMVQTY